MKKLNLTKEDMALYGGVAVAAAILLILIVTLLPPLMGRIAKQKNEYRGIETRLKKARKMVEMVKNDDTDKVLLTEKEVSVAIGEITKTGKLEDEEPGVDFISITPGKIEQDERPQYKILPIKIKIKSTYEQLGAFLGSLGAAKRGLVTVKSFNVTPIEGTPGEYMTNMVINMYLSGRRT